MMTTRGVAAFALVIAVTVSACGSDGQGSDDASESPLPLVSESEATPSEEADPGTVNAAGGTVELEQAQVVVPVGAVPDGQVAVVSAPDETDAMADEAEFVDIEHETIGGIVEVAHDGFDLAKPVTVTWDLSALNEFARATAVPVRLSEDGAVPADLVDGADWSLDGDALTLTTTEWSFWGWVANVGQTVGEVVGVREDGPSCSGEPLQDWVASVVRPDEDTNATPLRTCVEPDGDDVVTWRVVNNRPFTQRLVRQEGDGFAWTWDGPEKLGNLEWSLHEIARPLLNRDGRFTIPPLSEAAVGIGRPTEPGAVVTRYAGEVDLETMLVDAAVWSAGQVGIDGAFDDPVLNQLMSTVFECGLDQATGQPGVSDIVDVALSLLEQCVQQTIVGPVAPSLKVWALADPDNLETYRKLGSLGKASLLLTVGGVVFYGFDQLQNYVVGEFTIQQVSRGPEPPVTLPASPEELGVAVAAALTARDTDRLTELADGDSSVPRRGYDVLDIGVDEVTGPYADCTPSFCELVGIYDDGECCGILITLSLEQRQGGWAVTDIQFGGDAG